MLGSSWVQHSEVIESREDNEKNEQRGQMEIILITPYEATLLRGVVFAADWELQTKNPKQAKPWNETRAAIRQHSVPLLFSWDLERGLIMERPFKLILPL